MDGTSPTARIRYRTLGGAIVTVTESAPGSGGNRFAAACTGCLAESEPRGTLGAPRDWANAHAEKCRALPQPV